MDDFHLFFRAGDCVQHIVERVNALACFIDKQTGINHRQEEAIRKQTRINERQEEDIRKLEQLINSLREDLAASKISRDISIFLGHTEDTVDAENTDH